MLTETIVRKRQELRCKLQSLDLQMNATIGVQMSPGSLAKQKKTQSIRERRSETETSRKRLREAFDKVLMHDPSQRTQTARCA